MKVVRNKTTGRLVYHQIPDFEKGKGIINAVILGFGAEKDLEEVEVTEAQWQTELQLREQEHPIRDLAKEIDDLKAKIVEIDNVKADVIALKDKVKALEESKLVK